MLSSWKSCCSLVPQKWIFTILAITGMTLAFLYASFLSITILEMVTKTGDIDEEVDGTCQRSDTSNKKNATDFFYETQDDLSIKRYPWDEYTQGIILSSFAWSYMIGRLFYPLVKRFGGKYVLGFGVFLQGLATFITPFTLTFVDGGQTALIITRVIVGLGNSMMYPAVSTMIAHWTTPSDRTAIGSAIYNGAIIGCFFGYIIPAMMIEYLGTGWPTVFYFVGFLGIIWFPFWLLMIYERPEVHPFISDNELQYFRNSAEAEKINIPSPPWKHIFKCKEFWAFTIVYTGSNWALYVILSGLPRYMAQVVKLSLEDNGYVSSMPFILMWLNSLASAWISDRILEKQWISVTNVRKILVSLTTIGPPICLLLASYAECDKTIVVTMFVFAVTLMGHFLASGMLNPLDLSPNYADLIMGIGEGIGSTIAVLAPYAIGVLAPNSTITEWRVIFWIVFAFAVVSDAVYLYWYKVEIQPWNDPNFERKKISTNVE